MSTNSQHAQSGDKHQSPNSADLSQQERRLPREKRPAFLRVSANQTDEQTHTASCKACRGLLTVVRGNQSVHAESPGKQPNGHFSRAHYPFSSPVTLSRRLALGRPERLRFCIGRRSGEIRTLLQHAVCNSCRLIRIKRAGQSSLGLLLQAVFIAAHEDQEGEEGKDSQHDRYDPHWPGQSMHVVTQKIAARSIERGPQHASQGIEEQKAFPPHPVGPGQERGPHAEESDEAPEKDHLAAVPHEEIEPQFQLALIEAKEATVAAQQTVPALAPGPEAEVIAQDRSARSCRDHQWKRELVRRPGIDRRHQQHGFAREGNTGTLDGNTGKDCPVAVGGEERRQARYGHREHGYNAFSCYKDNKPTGEMPYEPPSSFDVGVAVNLFPAGTVLVLRASTSRLIGGQRAG